MAFDREAFRDLYPFEPHHLDVGGGVRLHYLDVGKGEPVLCLHGNPTWSFYYRNVAEDLRDRFRVIVPDHVGCGLSDKPGDDRYEYVLERRVADVTALVERLALDKVSLVVHDWGGMIGFAWAVRHPERVTRIVALNTSAFRLPAAKPLPCSLRVVRSPLGPALVRGANGMVRSALRWCAARPLDARVALGLAAPYDSWANRIAVLRFVEDIPLDPSHRSWRAVVETEEALGRLSGVPLLIGWGERDFVFDDHFLREWKRRFPAAEVHAFADAGHYVLEDAGERLAPVLREFLSRTSP